MKNYLILFILPIFLAACGKPAEFHFPQPLTPANKSKKSSENSGQLSGDKEIAAPEKSSPRFLNTPPAPRFLAKVITAPGSNKVALPEIEPATLNIHDMPLPGFINELYGNLLGLSFEVSPQLADQSDLITLRTTTPLDAKGIFSLANRVLANYGVGVQQLGDLLRFVPSKETGGATPLIVSGRTLPDVPPDHRPIFFYAQLNVVKNTHIAQWLRITFQNQQLQIEEDTARNAIIFIGRPDVVAEAMDLIQVLDQPFMRGRHSLRIDPINISAQQLTKSLTDVLTTEGFAVSSNPASSSSIILLPMEPIQAILAFATTRQSLDHITKWVLSLDKPSPQKNMEGIFFYDVQNTTATKLAATINNLLGGNTAVNNSTETSYDKAKKEDKPAVQPMPRSGDRVVADELRNSLVFRGSPQQWREILQLVRNFDRPSKQVLIEVTIAEITLTDKLNKGVEWKNFNGTSHAFNPDATITAGTLDALGLYTGGFNFALESAGNTKALLNLFASDNRVDIISVPRVLVKSGVEARIDVGTDVPTITSSQSSSDGAFDTKKSTGLLQSIEYRKTGVLLGVKPVVFSGNRVDLKVSQEISDVSSTSSSNVQSPSILTRKIETEVTLTDGGSILLGGLISNSTTEDSTGVPLLKDIPLLGQLFRTDSKSSTKQMVVMLIVPYIINDQHSAAVLTKAMKTRLQQEVDNSGTWQWLQQQPLRQQKKKNKNQ